MKTLGKKIKEARTAKGLTLQALSDLVFLAPATLSDIERGAIKSIAPETLIRISDALNDPDLLLFHCDSCPIRQHIMLRQFPELNKIKRDPALIASKLREELQEAADAAAGLSSIYMRPDFQENPDLQVRALVLHEQIADAERCIEILKFELLRSGEMTLEQRREVVRRQQEKCEAHGYHKPTGTDGQ